MTNSLSRERKRKKNENESEKGFAAEGTLQVTQDHDAEVAKSTKKLSRKTKGGGPTVQALCLRNGNQANCFQFLIYEVA